MGWHQNDNKNKSLKKNLNVLFIVKRQNRFKNLFTVFFFIPFLVFECLSQLSFLFSFLIQFVKVFRNSYRKYGGIHTHKHKEMHTTFSFDVFPFPLRNMFYFLYDVEGVEMRLFFG